MKDFAAIDFETANNERTSVCSVGVIIVRNGEIVDSFNSLIQPEPNYYNYWCTQVHGLKEEDTEDAPIFPEVWSRLPLSSKGFPSWRTTRLSTKVAFVPLSAATRWTIPNIRSSAHSRHHGKYFPIWKTTSCIPWHRNVGMF